MFDMINITNTITTYTLLLKRIEPPLVLLYTGLAFLSVFNYITGEFINFILFVIIGFSKVNFLKKI